MISKGSNSKKKRGVKGFKLPHFSIVLAMGAIIAVLAPILLLDTPWPTYARDFLETHAIQESGAINIVSAIYLGYRAFDTLGETIVLLVAVSGTISILSKAGAHLTKGYTNNIESEISQENIAPETSTAAPKTAPVKKIPKVQVVRTHLVEVVTGFLGPIVLIFGFYVMLYGHLSPGGGFQGGVVIASGIVFLAMGNRIESTTMLTRANVLARIEAIAFLLLLLAAISSMIFGGGFFDNPLLTLPGSPPIQNPVGYIILLNAIIGLKVGAGIGFMCIAILGKELS